MPKKLNLTKKIFIASFAAVLLTFFILVAILLSNFIVRTNEDSESVTSPSFDIYMISLSKSQVEKESLARAGDFQKIGAGGFVWQQDSYYHVITSAYIEKNDAVLVQNSIKLNQNLESEIITVSFPSISIMGSFTSEEKKILSRSLMAIKEYYLSIFDIAISLDTGVYNEISARLAVNSAHNTLNNIVDDYNTLFPSVQDKQLALLKEMLNNASQISTLLCGGEKINDGQTYSSILKYRYLEMLGIYYDFANS